MAASVNRGRNFPHCPYTYHEVFSVFFFWENPPNKQNTTFIYIPGHLMSWWILHGSCRVFVAPTEDIHQGLTLLIETCLVTGLWHQKMRGIIE